MWFQVIAKDMIAKGHSGSIVNICSLGTRAPLPMVSIYSMTKSAVERLSKSMAKELGPHKVLSVCMNLYGNFESLSLDHFERVYIF